MSNNKLIVGNNYKLKRTGEFCNIEPMCIDNVPSTDYIDKINWKFVGNIITWSGNRNIFYNEDNNLYMMFNAGIVDYVEW